MKTPSLVAFLVLGLSGTATGQALDSVLQRSASDLKRAAEQAARDAAAPRQAAPTAPPPFTAPVAATGTAAPGATAGLPPGWKPRAPHALEQSFIPPQATTKVASDVRRLASPGPSNLWHGNVISERIEIDNRYLDPDDRFFSVIQRMTCMADGSLAVFSRAKLQPDGYMKGNPYATGAWRIAADGAITSIGGARHTISENKDPFCGVSAGRSGLDPEKVGPASTAADGGIVFPYGPLWAFGRKAVVLGLTPDARLEPVPNDIQTCALEPAEVTKKRFNDVDSAVQDPQGNTYVWDRGACTLYRVALDGATSVLLPPGQACPKGKPENIFRGDAMAWDAAHGELVAAGDLLWLQAPDADNYSTIWRVRPDGQTRRVFLARKTGKTPQLVDGIGGLAVDARGTIFFGAGVVRGNGYQIMRLDEAKGRGEVVAGRPSPGGFNHGDGPMRQAQFEKVWGLCFMPDGTLFVHDGTHIIRRITTAGQVTTWAF